jgi:hypothetical protein
MWHDSLELDTIRLKSGAFWYVKHGFTVADAVQR